MNIPEFCFLEKLDSYTSSAANCIFSFTHVSYTFSQSVFFVTVSLSVQLSCIIMS